MSETNKIIAGIVAFIVIGFFMVGSNKEQSNEQMEAASMIRTYAALQSMANRKCPRAIEEKTGDKVFFPSNTKSDKDTYVTMEWDGTEKNKFKKASCTLHIKLGGISELIIDGETVIKKNVD